MQLYAGTSTQFIEDASQHRIAEKLRFEFFRAYRYQPSPNEIRSWQNSLQAMCLVLALGNFDDQGVILEFQLPLSSLRLDVMLTGRDEEGSEGAVVVELKQWGEAIPAEADGVVSTFIGGRVRDVLHPSVQVGQYKNYLADCHTVFSEDGVGIDACAFLHNMQFNVASELFAERHKSSVSEHPIFCGDQSSDLTTYLKRRVGGGDGQFVLAKVLESKYRPSKKLLEHTASMVAGQSDFVLLDEQLVVLQTVLAEAKRGLRETSKAVILVKGGPGTGKSVVALHLVGELAKLGINAQHATGSKAFTENIQRVVGSRAKAQFRYFHSYADAEYNNIDVLVMDEAHRIRATSVSRYTPKDKRSGIAQIEELLRATKVAVFFIDDLQVVRPNEVGSADLIRSSAKHIGASLHEFELEAQFRCAGSAGFINWVDNTLGIRRTANILWDGSEGFEFRIVDSVEELESLIRDRAENGESARLMAGYCWPWSNPTMEGNLVSDVQVGTWGMPWNARPDSGSLAPGIPKSHFWASDNRGLDQVGCVYTAQGFEFDYAGVIFGRDLRYDLNKGEWIGDKTMSHDRVVKGSKAGFLELVKNTYRVLLTRGMKGCFVYFEDNDTRNFIKSRIEASEIIDGTSSSLD